MKAATVPKVCSRMAAANRLAEDHDYLPRRMDASPERTFSYYPPYYIIIYNKKQEELPNITLGRMDNFGLKDLVKKAKKSAVFLFAFSLSQKQVRVKAFALPKRANGLVDGFSAFEGVY